MNHLFTGIKSKDKILIIFAISILLILFNRAHAWFLWQIDEKIFMYVNLFIDLWFMMTHKQRWIRFDLYCCPLKLKMAKTSNPKPCKIGLRAYSFKK